MFYTLNRNCNIVYGTNGASIYNLETGKMYNIEKEESGILNDIQRGKSIIEIQEVYGAENVKRTCNRLEENGIVTKTQNFYPHEEYRQGKFRISRLEKEYRIHTCYIQLPFECNRNCNFCNQNKLLGCFSCSKTLKGKAHFDFNFYKMLVDELKKFDCKNFVIYGGDLLEHFSEVQTLVTHIGMAASIGLIIPVGNKDHKILQNFADMSGVYIIKNEDYQELENVKYCQKNNVTYNFNVPLSREKEAIEKLQLLKNNGINTMISFYSKERIEMNYGKEFPQIQMDKRMYKIVEDINPCLFGKITIKCDKKIYSCMNSRKSIGQLSAGITQGLEKSFPQLVLGWESSYTKRKNCAVCKYGKSCIDCRSFEENFGGDLSDKECSEYI